MALRWLMAQSGHAAARETDHVEQEGCVKLAQILGSDSRIGASFTNPSGSTWGVHVVALALGLVSVAVRRLVRLGVISDRVARQYVTPDLLPGVTSLLSGVTGAHALPTALR